MRVLQLIDSLRPGGAEKMAVNYANALAQRINGSYLCCTRIEGLLIDSISPEVEYLFLEKKKTLDLKAFLKLRKFVQENKIDIIQAHSNSWFLALWVKLSLPGTKLVWHDHWGARASKKNRTGILSLASSCFDGVITVNENLKEWAVRNLKSKKVQYLPNFFLDAGYRKSEVSLNGEGTLKIVHLANLKPPKDHITLLKAFDLLEKDHPNISLHLIGKDEEDSYSDEIKNFLRDKCLQDKVFIYGELHNVEELLRQGDLGVLSSKSEGLPVALLEYGRAGLPVVCTRVGQCAEVVKSDGKVVPPANSYALAAALRCYIENEDLRKKEGTNYQAAVLSQFSERVILPEVLHFLDDL